MSDNTGPGDDVRYYATISGDLDLVAIGGEAQPARCLDIATGGTLVIHNRTGQSRTLTVASGQTLRCWVSAIIAAGTTAAGITVTW